MNYIFNLRKYATICGPLFSANWPGRLCARTIVAAGCFQSVAGDGDATIRLQFVCRGSFPQKGISSSEGSSGSAGLAGAERLVPPPLLLLLPPPPRLPPPAESSRPPRSWRFSPTTLSFERFCPVCLSSQVSSWRRPSIMTGRPFLTYSPAISAGRPQRVTSTKVVSSRFSPPSVV